VGGVKPHASVVKTPAPFKRRNRCAGGERCKASCFRRRVLPAVINILLSVDDCLNHLAVPQMAPCRVYLHPHVYLLSYVPETEEQEGKVGDDV